MNLPRTPVAGTPVARAATDLAPVVAIDGPSGAGKGTLCRWLAERLGWHLLDSGALYRLTALAALDRGLPLGGPQAGLALARLAASLELHFATDGTILLFGERVEKKIRSEACGNAASKVAVLKEVRSALLDRQRAFRRPPGLVADGRDMGTVVFPDAKLKIFLQASAEERAKRRYKQLKEKGIGASLAALAETIAERDARDAARVVAPLRPAADAVLIDTTGLSIEDTRQRALALIERHV